VCGSVLCARLLLPRGGSSETVELPQKAGAEGISRSSNGTLRPITATRTNQPRIRNKPFARFGPGHGMSSFFWPTRIAQLIELHSISSSCAEAVAVALSLHRPGLSRVCKSSTPLLGHRHISGYLYSSILVPHLSVQRSQRLQPTKINSHFRYVTCACMQHENYCRVPHALMSAVGRCTAALLPAICLFYLVNF
jgi:hypothetical protein